MVMQSVTKPDPVLITVLLLIVMLNSAFLDVVIDALMVTQSRLDQENGSQDLQGLSWAVFSIGGIIGSLCSAYFTEYLKPTHAFLAYGILSIFIVVGGFNINPQIEENTLTSERNQLSILQNLK